ncbi:hypothetical protein ACOMHN_045126 [Nucella lapillus]
MQTTTNPNPGVTESRRRRDGVKRVGRVTKRTPDIRKTVQSLQRSLDNLVISPPDDHQVPKPEKSTDNLHSSSAESMLVNSLKKLQLSSTQSDATTFGDSVVFSKPKRSSSGFPRSSRETGLGDSEWADLIRIVDRFVDLDAYMSRCRTSCSPSGVDWLSPPVSWDEYVRPHYKKNPPYNVENPPFHNAEP